MDKKYTPDETAKYIAERNAKRSAERAKRKPKLIWDSKKQGTFKGSLRKEFLDVKPEVNEIERITEE